MKITRNNYEVYFIDYLEGTLDNKMVDDFIEFLQQNHDLKEELSLFENVSMQQEEITFNKKDLLLKEKYDVEKEFNEAAIAELEGDISSLEKTEFEAYLSTHPEKQKDAELFRLTKLQPDQSVLYTKKDKLYHRPLARKVYIWSMRAAAVLVVLLSVYIFIDKSQNQIITQNQIAVQEKEPEKKENIPAITEVPQKVEKRDVQPVIQKRSNKPVLNKEKPKTEPAKSLRENSKGRLDNEDLAVRTNDQILPEIKSINPSVFAGIAKPNLVSVDMVMPETSEPNYEEKYFVDMVKEKTGLEKLTINKITKAGLTLVSNLSKEKFNYETNKEGKVTELKYDSRILAFSIPTNRETDGK